MPKNIDDRKRRIVNALRNDTSSKGMSVRDLQLALQPEVIHYVALENMLRRMALKEQIGIVSKGRGVNPTRYCFTQEFQKGVPSTGGRKVLWVIRNVDFKFNRLKPDKIFYDGTKKLIASQLVGKYVGVDRLPMELKDKEYYESKGWYVVEL